MEQLQHPMVRHPRDLIHERQQAKRRHHKILFYNDQLLEWITDHVLASVLLFDLALILPLLVMPGPDGLKITLGVISGSWIQLWALPALQRSQNKTQRQNEAKAEVDHQTLSYLASTQDAQSEALNTITQLLTDLKRK